MNAYGGAIALMAFGAWACGPAPPRVGAPQRQSSWEWNASGAGAALILHAAGGEELLRFSCVRDPPALEMVVPDFSPLMGTQPLALSAGGEPFLMVADRGRQGPGVHATGPIPPDLFDRLHRADTISASYGGQYLGPYPPPEQTLISDFTNACGHITARNATPPPIGD